MQTDLDIMKLNRLEDNFFRAVPATSAKIHTVTLPDTADTPFDVEHGLTSGPASGVRYVLLQAAEPVLVYQNRDDVSGPTYIRLRATSIGGVVRLMLFRDTAEIDELPPRNVGLASFNVPGELGADTVFANQFLFSPEVYGGDISATGTVSAVGGYYERSRSALLGEWTSTPYSAGDYSGSGAMTWSVTAPMVGANRYTLIGKTMVWDILISGGVVGGTPSSELRVLAPAGVTFGSGSHFTRVAYSADNGVYADAYVQVLDSTHIAIKKISGTNWTAGAATAYLQITVSLT